MVKMESAKGPFIKLLFAHLNNTLAHQPEGKPTLLEGK